MTSGLPCREVADLLPEALTGPVDPAVADVVRAHLATCGECRAQAAALGDVVTLLRDLPDPAPPRGYWEALNKSLERALGMRIRSRRPLVTALGALVVAVILASFSTLRSGEHVGEPPGPVPRGAITASVREILPAVEELATEFGAGIVSASEFDRILAPDPHSNDDS